jgi:DNA-binding LacI/PurR family transcriptional regulator
MTMYLISQGFRKITVLANSDFGVDHQRIKGYKAALFESAIPSPAGFFHPPRRRKGKAYTDIESPNTADPQ